jgi:thioredoxin 1
VIFKALISSGPVLVDFYATWCGPCKAVAPKIGEFSEKYEKVRFLQIDVDKMRGLAQQFNITAMPTFVMLKDGQEVHRVRGADLKSIDDWLQKQ